MNIEEQGVLIQSKLISSLVHLFLLFILSSIFPVSADTPLSINTADSKQVVRHHVYFLSSPDIDLHSKIMQKLSEDLSLQHAGITIENISLKNKFDSIDSRNGLVVAIGPAAIENAIDNYPHVSKLFISTDAESFKPDDGTDKNDAILYMTQSYCRQIHLIRLLNKNWKTISILNSQKKPIDRDSIQDCSNRYRINTYIVSTDVDEDLNQKIKHALHHSDVLLALPDSDIYNSKSVKNILLTSYRYRKPVIAFSRNFVNAGALAAIHSSSDHLALSTSELIRGFFDSGNRFQRSVNHPQAFDVSINKQVFRALDLALPDVRKITESIESDETGKP